MNYQNGVQENSEEYRKLLTEIIELKRICADLTSDVNKVRNELLSLMHVYQKLDKVVAQLWYDSYRNEKSND